MLWTWVAFALTLGASTYAFAWALKGNPGVGGYALPTIPILMAAFPLVWRQRTRAATVSAILLAAFSVNPLVWWGQWIYLPASFVMFIAAWRFSGEKLFSMRVG